MNNIGLSFLAGLALNLMPCILPILLIKIYEIIKYSKYKNNLKLASLATTLGILCVFSIFGIINIAFQYLGKNFNFGFSFQNPYFLIIVIFILFLFLLNLLNFFHFNYSSKITNYLQIKYEKSKNLKLGIFFENFITAIFMVFFAIPCSIPIIGTVATFSLTSESHLSIFLNFLAMGFGMSLPFILILIYPNLLDFLKNKKSLLYAVQNIIIILLILTILWLLYILKSITGISTVVTLLGFLGLLALQFKIIKKSHQSLILIFLIVTLGTTTPVLIFQEGQAVKIENSLWKQEITTQEIQEHINNNKTIFINISAKWCMVCNLNNITVFSKFNVLNFLNKQNIIAIKIDITQNNTKAEKFYENPNNIYVPKYIIYNKNNPNGCSFTGQLTEKKFFKEIKKCN